ncbi:MAG: PilZ domain-containing protein [Lachnospira sp.]|nr:PilZ domain-containing protein [Lachnospira sp.]
MLLIELVPETKVIFELDMNGQKYEFASVVKEQEKTAIYTEPIRINGKVLSFNGAHVTVSLIMNRAEKSPVVWKGVGVTTISGKAGTRYMVVANGEGFEMNRRDAFRLFIGVNGVVQMGTNRKALDIIVKDVSDTGFSFVCEEDFDKPEGKPVRLVFTDMNQNFSLVGLVVRKVLIAEKKIIYGCKLSIPNKKLGHYINEKQRQILSMNKDNAASKAKNALEQALKENSRDQSTEEDMKKMIRGDGKTKRNIDTVGKVERREVFKDKLTGKRV